MDEERRAARAIADAWTDLETGPLAELLDPRVRYESRAVEMLLEGRPEVIAYLERKMQLIEMVGEEAHIEARLVRLDVRGDRRWAVLSKQGALERAAVFLPSVDAAGAIVAIEVLTDAEILARVSCRDSAADDEAPS